MRLHNGGVFYPLGYTGARKPCSQIITVEDIALGLSREHRFGNQCREDVEWTVAHHTFLGWRLLTEITGTVSTLLWWFLHDAHEAIAHDIPKTMKTDARKDLEREIDQTIRFSLGLPLDGPGWEAQELISMIDAQCFVAEALVVGPPAFDEHCVDFKYPPNSTHNEIVENMVMLVKKTDRKYWQQLYAAKVHNLVAQIAMGAL